MSLAEDWLEMARESNKAAHMLADTGGVTRSAVSRAYYTAFQAATAMLHHVSVTPPFVGGQLREAWSHTSTPEMVRDHLAKLIPDTKFKTELASKLGLLYKLRCESDYESGTWAVANINHVLRDAGLILKVAEDRIMTS